PWISKGSAISEPRLRDALNGVIERGGRVVVLDPRATPTAKQFEHIAIKPGTDAYLFLAMINVIVAENLHDQTAVTNETSGFEELVAVAQQVDVDFAAVQCEVPSDVIVNLARDLANAKTATVYGRTGTCTQRFGTLNNLLMET